MSARKLWGIETHPCHSFAGFWRVGSGQHFGFISFLLIIFQRITRLRSSLLSWRNRLWIRWTQHRTGPSLTSLSCQNSWKRLWTCVCRNLLMSILCCLMFSQHIVRSIPQKQRWRQYTTTWLVHLIVVRLELWFSSTCPLHSTRLTIAYSWLQWNVGSPSQMMRWRGYRTSSTIDHKRCTSSDQCPNLLWCHVVFHRDPSWDQEFSATTPREWWTSSIDTVRAITSTRMIWRPSSMANCRMPHVSRRPWPN